MRRFILTVVVSFVLAALAGHGHAQVPPPDRVLGRADAPITIIEYASLTCPHCAMFHKDILPQLKATYIDTGKAKLIYRDFPLDQVALKAAALARCAPEERYFAFLDVLFQQQSSWASAPDPMVPLARIGRLGGLSEAQFKSCMEDQALADSILASRLVGARDMQVESTPTILINEKKIPGVRGFEDLDAVLKPLAR
jgi:protein-disulfide isomerase